MIWFQENSRYNLWVTRKGAALARKFTRSDEDGRDLKERDARFTGHQRGRGKHKVTKSGGEQRVNKLSKNRKRQLLTGFRSGMGLN